MRRAKDEIKTSFTLFCSFYVFLVETYGIGAGIMVGCQVLLRSKKSRSPGGLLSLRLRDILPLVSPGDFRPRRPRLSGSLGSLLNNLDDLDNFFDASRLFVFVSAFQNSEYGQ